MNYDKKLNNKSILNVHNDEKTKEKRKFKKEEKKELKNKESNSSLIHSSFDNDQSKQNLGTLLGLYYSSEEENEVNTEEMNEIININKGKKESKDECGYNNTNEKKIDEENKSEIKTLGKIDDESEKTIEIINKKKIDGQDEKVRKIKNEKETNESLKKDEIKNEIKMNVEKSIIENYPNQEKSVIENDNNENKTIMKNKNKGADEKYQTKCDKFKDNTSTGIINEGNNVLHSQINSVNNEFNKLQSYNINKTYVNYPYNIYGNNNYQYNIFNNGPLSYNMNNSSMLYPNNVNIKNKSENFFNNIEFSKNKEKIDLSNIPIIDQSKLLSEWKPTIMQEEKKSKKYNIKTKVYNPVNNTFDKVIIHGKNQKRKHQINWLAKEAVEKEYEIIQKTNYNKRRTTNDKYGW